jgi:hypothetical protein
LSKDCLVEIVVKLRGADIFRKQLAISKEFSIILEITGIFFGILKKKKFQEF